MIKASLVAGALLLSTHASADVVSDLAALDRDIATKPKAAEPHMRRAEKLLAIGAGAAARREAASAVKLEPKSATAYTTLAYVLRADLLGRDLHAGFDRKGAIAAYTKALALEPGLMGPATAYAAALTELDDNGDLSFAPADLAAAEKLWRAGKDAGVLGLTRVLLREQNADAEKVARTIERGITRDSLVVAAIAVRDAKAAYAYGNSAVPSKDRPQLYRLASHELASARQYKAAYDLALLNGDVVAGTPQATLFASVKPAEPPRSLTDPLAVVREALISALEPGGSLAPFDSKQTRDEVFTSSRGVTTAFEEESRWYLRDIIRTAMNVKLVDSTKTLWRVQQDFVGLKTFFYVARVDGKLHVVGTTNTVESVARFGLRLYGSGNKAEARTLLSWLAADLASTGSPTHDLAWGGTEPSDDDSLESALAWATSNSDPKRVIPVVEKCRSKSASASFQCPNARIESYVTAHRWKELEAFTRSDISLHPDISGTRTTQILALTKLGRLDDADAAYKAALTAVKPLGRVHEVAVGISIARGDLAEAEKRAELAATSNDAGASPFANGAWFFVGAQRNFKRGLEILAKGEDIRPKNPGMVNTRAALEALSGDVVKASSDALWAMSLRGASELEDGDRFVFGLIYEQAGLLAEARAMYKPITEDDGPFYTVKTVATARLAALQKH